MNHESDAKEQARNGMPRGRSEANSAVWIPIGMGAGIALGLALDNLALGIAIGAGLGVVIGGAAGAGRTGADTQADGTTARRWMYAAAAAGGLLVLAGMTILAGWLAR